MSTRVLIVEDNDATREALSLLLQTGGYTTAEAANGREALVYLRSHEPPRLVLLDLMMPVMDGWQFRAEQRRDPRLANVPVIVCSAQGGVEQRAGSLEAACYLNKPVEVEELLAVVRRYTA